MHDARNVHCGGVADLLPLVPAQAGTQHWIPVCTGMSGVKAKKRRPFRAAFFYFRPADEH